MKVKATISRATIASMARGLERETDNILKLTQQELEEIAKDGADYAKRLIQNEVEYDGSVDESQVDVTMTPTSKWKWEVLMYGPAAASIEYGSTSNGKHDYWFFGGRGRQEIVLRAGGSHARYERVIRREGFTERWMGRGANGFGRQEYSKFVPYETASRHRDNEGKWRLNDPVRVKGGEKDRLLNTDPSKPEKRISGGANEYKVHRYVHDPKMKKWVDKSGKERGAGYATTLVEKPDSYITKGNKPNNVMKRTFEYMVDEVEKLTK